MALLKLSFPLFLLCLITVEATICPALEDTTPCACHDGLEPWEPRKHLQCTAGSTDETWTNFLTQVRAINNVSSDNPLSVVSLTVHETALTTLDLSLLADIQFESVSIQYNHQLTGIASGSGKFSTGLIIAQQSGITDATLAQLLSHIEAESLKKIVILGSEVHGSAVNGSAGGEFLPGLTNFKNLDEFRIEQSGQVQILTGGQFKGIDGLTHLTFMSVHLQEVGKDAFLLDPPRGDLENVQFNINLGFNEITQDKFSVDHGLLSIGRPLFVYLEGNKFEFVDQATWESVLLQDQRHFLDFEWNQFVCDSRMQWLRDGKARYQAQVKGVVCSNDPDGKDIFETDLLP